MGPKYQGTVKLKLKAGDFRTVEVWTQGRNGTMAPVTHYFRYNNRWVPPIEYLAKYELNMSIWLRIYYCGANMADLIYNYNPLFKMISKSDAFKGATMPLPSQFKP